MSSARVQLHLERWYVTTASGAFPSSQSVLAAQSWRLEKNLSHWQSAVNPPIHPPRCATQQQPATVKTYEGSRDALRPSELPLVGRWSLTGLGWQTRPSLEPRLSLPFTPPTSNFFPPLHPPLDQVHQFPSLLSIFIASFLRRIRSLASGKIIHHG